MYNTKIPNIGKMSQEQALKIADDLLEAFNFLFHSIPVRLTTCIETNKQNFRIVTRNSDGSGILESMVVSYKHPDFLPDNIHLLIWKNRIFEITIYDSPEVCGYCSISPFYDNETYVFCSIAEKRASGETKYEMYFGFDIEKMTFVELFDINHLNINGFIRESRDSIEPLLSERVLF